jgi:hypothetical protein
LFSNLTRLETTIRSVFFGRLDAIAWLSQLLLERSSDTTPSSEHACEHVCRQWLPRWNEATDQSWVNLSCVFPCVTLHPPFNRSTLGSADGILHWYENVFLFSFLLILFFLVLTPVLFVLSHFRLFCLIFVQFCPLSFCLIG